AGLLELSERGGAGVTHGRYVSVAKTAHDRSGGSGFSNGLILSRRGRLHPSRRLRPGVDILGGLGGAALAREEKAAEPEGQQDSGDEDEQDHREEQPRVGGQGPALGGRG